MGKSVAEKAFSALDALKIFALAVAGTLCAFCLIFICCRVLGLRIMGRIRKNYTAEVVDVPLSKHQKQQITERNLMTTGSQAPIDTEAQN